MALNLATQEIEYKVVEGSVVVTKLFVYPSGQSYVERTSRATFLGWPLFHMTIGRCPETGRRKVAQGWLAVGRIAFGGLAVGQLAVGIVALAQLGLGLVLALAQAGGSVWRSAGQLALAGKAAYGQVAVAGEEAVGQLAVARYALGQIGVGRHVVDMRRRDREALEHFAPLIELVMGPDLPAERPLEQPP